MISETPHDFLKNILHAVLKDVDGRVGDTEISLFFMWSQKKFSSSDLKMATVTFFIGALECFHVKSATALMMSSATVLRFFPEFPEKKFF